MGMLAESRVNTREEFGKAQMKRGRANRKSRGASRRYGLEGLGKKGRDGRGEKKLLRTP